MGCGDWWFHLCMLLCCFRHIIDLFVRMRYIMPIMALIGMFECIKCIKCIILITFIMLIPLLAPITLPHRLSGGNQVRQHP